ncbi:DUF1211 domain-containing protein [Periweissella cryptocerci]|uniref:DUF1211 domain-containing protein n=1 Tax=Periweissella cryptocerci TaxID=2506420 RepID=A0A4P6YUJ0_9LACO|nr:TMEM175 family protein [Periweissella cryptocerci]QBO36391.1 DUF1211 domain-containing protein [Periweissella cryptocerci]
MKIERLQAFSDGMYAILITILVLEFVVPEYQVGHLLDGMLNQWPIFFAYILSYVYVGTLWLFHHDFFLSLKQIDRKLNIINMVSLFTVTLINYPTLLVAATLKRGNINDLRVAFMTYAFVAMLISLTYFWLYSYAASHSELAVKGDMNKELYSRIKYDPWRSVAVYGLAIGLMWLSAWLGAAMVVAGIIWHFIAYMRLGRNLHELHAPEHKK